jgi:hypothetical protein
MKEEGMPPFSKARKSRLILGIDDWSTLRKPSYETRGSLYERPINAWMKIGDDEAPRVPWCLKGCLISAASNRLLQSLCDLDKQLAIDLVALQIHKPNETIS